jgi:hypothetical protein
MIGWTLEIPLVQSDPLLVLQLAFSMVVLAMVGTLRAAAALADQVYRAVRSGTLCFFVGGCGIGSCGVPRPSLAPYVRVTGSTKGRSSPEAMDLRETRSNSQIPTVFPHRFPVNSHASTSVEGLWDRMRKTRRFRRRLPRR